MPRTRFEHEARYRSANVALGARTPRAGVRFNPAPAGGFRFPAPEAGSGRPAPELGHRLNPAPSAAYRPGSPVASSRRF